MVRRTSKKLPKKRKNITKKMQPNKHGKTNQRNKRINQRKRGLIHMNLTNINEKQYEELKRNYLDAVNNNRDKFFIDGQPVLTKFAKYWLEFVENERKSRGERIYEPNKHDQTCINKNCNYRWITRTPNKAKVCPRCKHRQDI